MTLVSRYTYDPLDRLASRSPLAEAIALRFYKAGQLVTEVQDPEQRTYLRTDAQLLAQKNQTASTLLATDPQNSVLRAEDTPIAYTPYGHREAVTGLPGLPGFNGEEPDPVTGHYLLGNGYRAYNPILMRFNSPDSLSPFGEGGLNAYAYCVGDPVNGSDPTGHMFGKLGVLPQRRVAPMQSIDKKMASLAISRGHRATNKVLSIKSLNRSHSPQMNFDLKTDFRPPNPVFGDLPPHIQEKIIGQLPVNDMQKFALVSESSKEIVLRASQKEFRSLRVSEMSAEEGSKKLTDILHGRVPGVAPAFLWSRGITAADIRVIRKPFQIRNPLIRRDIRSQLF